jgi:hypothetical protein
MLPPQPAHLTHLTHPVHLHLTHLVHPHLTHLTHLAHPTHRGASSIDELDSIVISF